MTNKKRAWLLPMAAAVLAMPACLVWTTGGSKLVPVTMTVPQVDSVRSDIMTMMNQSAAAWNRGDVNAFVAYYDSLTPATFVEPKGVIRGRAAIRAQYAPRFAAGAQHDSLSFENVDVDVLAPDAVNVIAYYRLTRGDSTTAYGPTSLVVRKRGNAWKITHDHSS